MDKEIIEIIEKVAPPVIAFLNLLVLAIIFLYGNRLTKANLKQSRELHEQNMRHSQELHRVNLEMIRVSKSVDYGVPHGQDRLRLKLRYKSVPPPWGASPVRGSPTPSVALHHPPLRVFGRPTPEAAADDGQRRSPVSGR